MSRNYDDTHSHVPGKCICQANNVILPSQVVANSPSCSEIVTGWTPSRIDLGTTPALGWVGSPLELGIAIETDAFAHELIGQKHACLSRTDIEETFGSARSLLYLSACPNPNFMHANVSGSKLREG